MKLLLDTCAILWMDQAPDRLTAKARKAMNSADTLAISAISGFEIAIKTAKGHLHLGQSPAAWIARVVAQYNLTEFPIDIAIAAAAPGLEFGNQDPCDRILVATAVRHGLAIVTADPVIRAYPDVTVIW